MELIYFKWYSVGPGRLIKIENMIPDIPVNLSGEGAVIFYEAGKQMDFCNIAKENFENFQINEEQGLMDFLDVLFEGDIPSEGSGWVINFETDHKSAHPMN